MASPGITDLGKDVDHVDESTDLTPAMLLADLQRSDHDDQEQPSGSLDDVPRDRSPSSSPPPSMNHPDLSHIQNERTSFTADSPYFSSFCEKEIYSLNMLSDSLRGISARTKALVQSGTDMVEATRNLALACRLKRVDSNTDDEPNADEEAAYQLRKQAMGEEMVTLLGLLSNVSGSMILCVCVECCVGGVHGSLTDACFHGLTGARGDCVRPGELVSFPGAHPQ